MEIISVTQDGLDALRGTQAQEIPETASCAICGDPFTDGSPRPFCSSQCRNVYYFRISQGVSPAMDSFVCAYCGKVVTPAKGDYRYKYCDRICKRRYHDLLNRVGPGVHLVGGGKYIGGKRTLIRTAGGFRRNG